MYSALTYDVIKSYLTGFKTRKFIMAVLHWKQWLFVSYRNFSLRSDREGSQKKWDKHAKIGLLLCIVSDPRWRRSILTWKASRYTKKISPLTLWYVL